MNEKIWFLKRCNLFECLTAAEQRRLESRSVMKTFARGSIIYFPTDPGQSLLVLLRGRVKIKTITPDGKEMIFTFITPGEVFGELAIVDTAPRNEFAEAIQECQILAIPREAILELMARRGDLALTITKLVGFRLRRLENRLKHMLFHTVRERLVALLDELLETQGVREADGWVIQLPLSHQDLANLIGATRETVTLTLGQMQREGLLRLRRRRLVIVNRDQLTAEEERGKEVSREDKRTILKPGR